MSTNFLIAKARLLFKGWRQNRCSRIRRP